MAASAGKVALVRGTTALAAATKRQEACALVDTTDAFDPWSASAAGIELTKLLWVRCGDKKSYSPQRRRVTENTKEKRHDYRENEHRVEQALRAADLALS